MDLPQGATRLVEDFPLPYPAISEYMRTRPRQKRGADDAHRHGNSRQRISPQLIVFGTGFLSKQAAFTRQPHPRLTGLAILSIQLA